MTSKTKTTLEMDGIFTDEDAANRYFVMKPCVECGLYTKQDVRTDNKPCIYCGGAMGVMSNHWYSIRTFNTAKKISASDRKKMAGASK
jgi:hypothetical protein